jgi:hypothetical protein
MRSLLFRHKFTARFRLRSLGFAFSYDPTGRATTRQGARDRRVRRGKIRKGKAKDNPFLCVLSELCGENLILTITHHVYLIMAPLVSGSKIEINAGIGNLLRGSGI